MKTFRSFVAEFLGTFWLCFIAIAVVLSTSTPLESGVDLLGLALTYGLAWAVAVSVFGGISGGHVNPAVTVAMLVVREIKLTRAIGYVVSQLLGAALAAMLCNVLFPAEAIAMKHLGIPLPTSMDPLPAWVTVQTLLAVEFTLTFFVVIAYFGTVVDERRRDLKIAAFAIGLTVTLGVLAGGMISGASMNPARSFGPALVEMSWKLHWCYWAAPLAGAVLAALVYRYVLLEQDIELLEADDLEE